MDEHVLAASPGRSTTRASHALASHCISPKCNLFTAAGAVQQQWGWLQHGVVTCSRRRRRRAVSASAPHGHAATASAQEQLHASSQQQLHGSSEATQHCGLDRIWFTTAADTTTSKWSRRQHRGTADSCHHRRRSRTASTSPPWLFCSWEHGRGAWRLSLAEAATVCGAPHSHAVAAAASWSGGRAAALPAPPCHQLAAGDGRQWHFSGGD